MDNQQGLPSFSSWFQDQFTSDQTQTKQKETPARIEEILSNKMKELIIKAHDIINNADTHNLNEVVSIITDLNITRTKLKEVMSKTKIVWDNSSKASPSASTFNDLNIKDNMNLNRTAKDFIQQALNDGVLFDQIKGKNAKEIISKALLCRELCDSDVVKFDDALLKFINIQKNALELKALLPKRILELKEIADNIKSKISSSGEKEFVNYMSNIDKTYHFMHEIGGVIVGSSDPGKLERTRRNFYKDIRKEILEEGDGGESFIKELEKFMAKKANAEVNEALKKATVQTNKNYTPKSLISGKDTEIANFVQGKVSTRNQKFEYEYNKYEPKEEHKPEKKRVKTSPGPYVEKQILKQIEVNIKEQKAFNAAQYFNNIDNEIKTMLKAGYFGENPEQYKRYREELVKQMANLYVVRGTKRVVNQEGDTAIDFEKHRKKMDEMLSKLKLSPEEEKLPRHEFDTYLFIFKNLHHDLKAYKNSNQEPDFPAILKSFDQRIKNHLSETNYIVDKMGKKKPDPEMLYNYHKELISQIAPKYIETQIQKAKNKQLEDLKKLEVKKGKNREVTQALNLDKNAIENQVQVDIERFLKENNIEIPLYRNIFEKTLRLQMASLTLI